MVWFDTPKYGSEVAWYDFSKRKNEPIKLPVIDKIGIVIDLDKRLNKEMIKEEIKEMNMSGGYKKSSGA